MSGKNCVVVLIDESAAMSAVMRDKLADGSESVKTNATRVATSINNLLQQLSAGPPCDVAAVGYRSDPEGQTDVGCRWVGGLAGREFVSSSELQAAARNETRTRRLSQPDGTLKEEQVNFSIWYEPVLGAKAPQVAAFRFCRDLLGRWKNSVGSDAGQPLIVHVFSGASADGSPQLAVNELLQSSGTDSKPIVVQCHMAASSTLITTAFPSKQAYLASGMARDLFGRASELPDAMHNLLKAAKIKVQAAARAIVHNAKIGDLFYCLQLAKQHASANVSAATNAAISAGTDVPPVSAINNGTPPIVPSVESPPPDTAVDTVAPLPPHVDPVGHVGEPVGLAVLVLDRSVIDPFGGCLLNPCSKLQEAANEILKQLSIKCCLDLAIDTAIVSYGQSSDGLPDVRGTFDGPLAGRSCVRNTELPSGAIRVEEAETQVSNGAGGLITITKKTPIYFDVEPALAMSPLAAFTAAATILSDWCSQHPTGLPPIILHLTRGAQDAAEITAAIATVTSLATSTGTVLVHHLVHTESPHKALAYPDNSVDINGEVLKVLWEGSSPLPLWERLKEANRPYVTAESRGFVVNGKFDMLVDEFVNALKPA